MLAQHQLQPYIDENPNRIRIEGEAVPLPPDLATPFGLVLHELATNAAKYGSLSRPRGIVELRWTVSNRNDLRCLTVVWRERRGPSVAEARGQRFGGTLIESAMPHASVSREFRRDGLVCTIELPLLDTMENGIS